MRFFTPTGSARRPYERREVAGRRCGVNNGGNYKPSIRYRPSGVRTPNQLSRTC